MKKNTNTTTMTQVMELVNAVNSYNGAPIFRVLRGHSKTHKSDDVRRVTSNYSSRPVYASSNLGKAISIFDRLCEENFYDDMLLVVDFGLLRGRQRLVSSLSRSSATGGLMCHFDDLTPYLALAEYHGHESAEPVMFEDEMHVLCRGKDTIYKNRVQALSEFLNHIRCGRNAELVLVYKSNYTPLDREIQVVRTVATSKMIRNMDYRPLNNTIERVHCYDEAPQEKPTVAEVAKQDLDIMLKELDSSLNSDMFKKREENEVSDQQ